jgi:hypothetical protein
VSIVIVSMFVSSEVGGVDAIGSTGGGIPDDEEVAVDASAGGGGGVARRGSAGDSTGGAGGSPFDPKGHQLDACLTETGPCRIRRCEAPLRRCVDLGIGAMVEESWEM